MASSSNPPDQDALARIHEREYLYISNSNVSNFVSVKLSGYRNYRLWKKQMFCLMKAHDMHTLVDDGLLMNKYNSLLVEKYDNLLKGWIFGSVSEDVLTIIVDDGSAKDIWKKLESYFDSTMTSKQDSALTKPDTETKREDKNMDLGETTTFDNGMNSAESEAKSKDAIHIEIKETDDEVALLSTQRADVKLSDWGVTEKDGDLGESEANLEDTAHNKTTDSATTEMDKTDSAELRQLIADGNWQKVFVKLHEKKALTQNIHSYNDNTLLHMTVGVGDNELSEAILTHISNDELTEIKNLDGSTVLHIAAIVGNRQAAEFLVKKQKALLHTPDNKGQRPWYIAYENMHLDTIAYLLEAAEGQEIAHVDETGKTKSSLLPPVEIGVNILVNAISAKRYEFASKLITWNPQYVVSKNNVLMAMARTFPSGLDYGERLIYPSLKYTREDIVSGIKVCFTFPVEILSFAPEMMQITLRCEEGFRVFVFQSFGILFVYVPFLIFTWVVFFIFFLLMIGYIPLFMLYWLLWNGAAIVVPPIKNINKKKKEYKKAKEFLKLVLKTIPEKCPGSNPADLYTEPILEAARQDAYEVVIQILGRWPDAIRCKDKNGYDIIQLATIHRSERIYNIIYFLGERKSIYRTMEDSSKNNMLHLAGRLAPSNKLKRRTGAALQLQIELQWRKEVEKLVFPSYVTKENILMETPETIFTKEHENLVKEGEQWMKTVAESCSITAALITTIVFAAAITVPGGINQEGLPVHLRDPVFTIFAIADAISLFSSVTALLVFLSILTARFAEKDFLICLPRRLIIGLFTLFLSTTAMMIAFGATLFLVFSHRKLWVLVTTCGLALVPIACFLILQLPLILDLFRSTYISKFGGNRNRSNKLILNNIRLYFSK